MSIKSKFLDKKNNEGVVWDKNSVDYPQELLEQPQPQPQIIEEDVNNLESPPPASRRLGA